VEDWQVLQAPSTSADGKPAYASFLHVLRQRAVHQPGRIAFTFLRDGESDEANITYAELDRRACAIAAYLESIGVAGQGAMLLLPSGPEYIACFFGCMYAGVIAIPGFPVHFGRVRRDETWFRAVLADACPALAFAAPEMTRRSAKHLQQNSVAARIKWVDPQTIDDVGVEHWREPQVTAESIAFLQYTSGSTSAPKGVMISHGNILHNQQVIQAACNTDQESTVVGWLPLFHDMGLVGTVLQPVYLGARSVLMAPNRFLEKPVRWLRAITRYRAHSSTAPNFAYELCTHKSTPEEKKDLDLRSWRIAVNGAEPVCAETMDGFSAAFADCGFHAGSFFPCYGLAESTLMVSGGRDTPLPVVKPVSARALENNIVCTPGEGETARLLVGCGRVLLGQQVRIVDPHTLNECAEGTIGEIWVKGPSVAKGYWNRDQETSTTFASFLSPAQGPYLRTGDLGFFASGQLFISGRLKDLVIIRGRNLYPHDIEQTAQECHPAVTRNSGAAFAVETEGQDFLVVVNEVQQRSDAQPQQLIAAIREAVLLEYGVHVHAIVLVHSGTIPKTTSGKIRRRACRDRYLAGELKIIASDRYVDPSGTTESDSARLSRLEVLQAEPGQRRELIESSLREFLAAMLKKEPKEIARDQPLVVLGIDSLQAVEVSNFVDSWLRCKLDPVEILKGRSIDELVADLCDHIHAGEEVVVEPPGLEAGRHYPLSTGQRGLWVLHQAAPDSTAYILAGAARAGNNLDVGALRRAFQGVLARHPMLRTIFVPSPHGPSQVIVKMDDVPLDRHFRQVTVPAADEGRLPDLLAAESRRPFSLESEPPVRLLVFQLPSQEYVLMLALHHLTADLWSIAILLQDLGLLYSAQIQEKPPALPRIRSDYHDFVQWQARRLESPEGESLLRYWLEQLSGDLPILRLPADHPRPQRHSFRGSSQSIAFSPGLGAALHGIARSQKATLFMVLLAAFQILLHRISGQDDLLLGCPASGRENPAFSNVIGYFVNPIVLRSHFDGGVSFTRYLAAAMTGAIEGFAHQDYPFPLLVEKLHVQRSPGVPPLFQAMFVWQKTYARQFEALAPISLGTGGMPLQLGELSLQSMALEGGGSQFDLTVMMAEGESGLVGTLKFSTDIFDAATMQSLGRCFGALLESVVRDPHREVSKLSLLTEAERKSLIAEWTFPPPAQISGGPCVHELFAGHARLHPEKVGLICGEVRVTYADLNARANQFARHLRRLGVASETRVGLCLERSPEMIIALLGIWKAGGAYVPLDPRDPAERLSSLIDRSSLEVLITHEALLERLPASLPKLVLLDLDLDEITLEDATDQSAEVPPRSLAYVIHTSGSSGVPKGVMIEHGSLINLLEGLQAAIYANHDWPLVVGLNAPLSFDSSIKQILTLALGHTLCLVPEHVRRDAAGLCDYVQKTGMQVLDCTPTHLQILLETESSRDKCRLPALLIGGEPIPAGIWRALAEDVSIVAYNVYGPTECTVDATACRIVPEAQVNIGRRLRGTSLYLLGEDMEPVPNGAPGEIYLGGPSVGRGYWNQPELTAERFQPDPFSSIPGSRMYQTGDRARNLPDGSLQFLGRLDRQVKVRGYRLELAEVEAALARCAGVEDAAVVVRDGENGVKQLIGYAVTTEPHPGSHFRQLLGQTLPEYMLPARVVTIPKMPTTANGKRNYAALPIPDCLATTPGEDHVPPRTALEDSLARLWTETLGVHRVGVQDNFFALGGDSLQATRMMARVQEAYPTERHLLAEFLQQPTIAELARLIAAGTAFAQPRPEG
jgi:amino acid adenylation domain-containing protein